MLVAVSLYTLEKADQCGYAFGLGDQNVALEAAFDLIAFGEADEMSAGCANSVHDLREALGVQRPDNAIIDEIKTAGPGKVGSAGDMRPSREIEALVLAQIEPIDQVNHVDVWHSRWMVGVHNKVVETLSLAKAAR